MQPARSTLRSLRRTRARTSPLGGSSPAVSRRYARALPESPLAQGSPALLDLVDSKGSSALAFNLFRGLVSPQVEAHVEIEVPYFSTRDRLSRVLSFEELPAQHLFQAYIPRTNLDEILRRLGGSRSILSSLDVSMLSRARLRKVTDLSKETSQGTHYFLQLKTAKSGGVSRLELSIELPAPRFFKLLPLASAGAIEKLRYIKCGAVGSGRTSTHPAEAHFDMVLQAGPQVSFSPSPSRRALSSATPFIFIDVELPDPRLVARLDEPQRHSLSFLSQAVSILDHDTWIKKFTASRFIAAHGLNHRRVQKAVRSLTASVQSLKE